ncbi:HAD-IC family P-type ATPase [Klebsiella pneumoniae]
MKNDNAVQHNNQTASEQTLSPDEGHVLHKVRDPVCGMAILPDRAHSSIRYQDHQLYFCSASCESKFKAHPDRYLTEDASEHSHHHHHDHHEVSPDQIKQPHNQAEKENSEGVWTCPMHPEIRRSGPGSCPVCGMALEPLVATASTGPSDELHDMTRRFWLGLLLAFPVLVLEMGSHLFPDLRNTVPPQYNTWLQLLLASPVVLWCGWPFFARAGMSLRNRSLNMFTLVAMGTGVAWVYSVIATVFPSWFPASFRNMDGLVAVYFEAAAVITVLVLLGQVLELRAREQTSGAITALLNLAPKTARRLDHDGHETDINAEDVLPGDKLRIRPGESIPVDGIADTLRMEGATVIYVATDGNLAGLIAISDPVKATTPDALKALRQAGIRIVMLTGDNQLTAEAVARKLGIDEVEAGILPDGKKAVITRLKASGHVVAMAGDGVNDAPALAAADVGIAMGTGTDVAIESAGVTLLKGDLMILNRARHLSEITMKNIRQNLFFAFIYNALGVPVAAGLLYPVYGILLSPVIAAAAMALSSVSVIVNALRLKSVRLGK